ncbi:MAG: biotin/lipoyl-binding protein, partial [Rubricoccaceae bacterium]
MPATGSRPRHALLVALVLAVAGAGGLALYLGRSTPEAPVERTLAAPPETLPVTVLVVREGPLREDVLAEGRLVAGQQSAVSADASGLIRAVRTVPGARVAAGETLVELDDRAARLAVADAEGALARARAAQARAARADA